MAHYAGGCLCGAVRYAFEAEPLRHVLCHCIDCQRHTGSAFLSAIVFPTERVEMMGELHKFTMPGGQTGKPVHRWFCPNCGSSMMEGRDDTGRRLICAGTLDDRSKFKPEVSLFCEQAQDWFVMPTTENLPRYYPF